MNKKIIISVILSITLLMSVISPLTAIAEDKTLQQKEKILETMAVIDLAKDDYYPDDYVKRSDAVVYIVRILGEEVNVLMNSDAYKDVSYSDVSSSDWYAPYLGYCAQNNFISSSGNFQPNAFITEKSFLVMMLCALDYRPYIDFTWDTVYKKSYEVGLVSSVTYMVKTDDNTNFYWTDVADILYRALAIECRGTNEQLFNKLFDNGIVDRGDLADAGFVEADTRPSQITEVNVMDYNMISVEFNEDITDLSDISITELTNDGTELDVEIDSQSDDSVTLRTSAQREDKAYILEIGEVEDSEGNITRNLKTGFVGYKFEEVQSNFFRISSIKAENEKSIKVYFTQPVNLNSEISMYYRIEQDNKLIADGSSGELVCRVLSSEENCLLVSLTRRSLVVDEIYTLEVDEDLTSAYGVYLNDGRGDSMRFAAEEGKITTFELDDIDTIDDTTIVLEFNKEVNPFLAKQVYNFYLTDEDGDAVKLEKSFMQSIGSDKGKQIYLRTEKDLKDEEDYKVTINNMNDITKQEYIMEQTYSFEADFGRSQSLRLEDVDVINNQTLEVFFDNSLDPDTALNVDYYSIEGKSYSAEPIKAFFDPLKPDRVKLYLAADDELSKNKDYEINIDSRMKSYLGNTISSDDNEDFEGTSRDKGNPSLVEAETISSDSVKIEFDQEIALAMPNIDISNYILEYSNDGMSIQKVPIGILYIDPKTLILRFDKLEPDINYILRATEVLDYSGESINGSVSSQINFELD